MANGLRTADLVPAGLMVDRVVRLGEFTDHVAAAERLKLWSLREADDHARRAFAHASRQESVSANRARRTCIRWWTASRRETLARQLKRILQGKKTA